MGREGILDGIPSMGISEIIFQHKTTQKDHTRNQLMDLRKYSRVLVAKGNSCRRNLKSSGWCVAVPQLWKISKFRTTLALLVLT